MQNDRLYISPKEIDLSKNKTILWLNVKKNEPQYIHHIDTYIENALREQFNVVKLIISGKQEKNEWKLNKGFTAKLDRSADNQNYLEDNKIKMFNELDKTFSEIGHIDYCFVNSSLLPLPMCSYVSYKDSVSLSEAQNEFFDYTTNISENEKKLIDEANSKILGNFYRYCSLYAFSTTLRGITFLVHEYLSVKKICDKFFIFAIDPVAYYPKWMEYGNTQLLYFTNDRRGSRHMDGFDLAQINHLTNTTIDDDFSSNKENMFTWIGTVFNRKGSRPKVYDTYIKNLNGKINYKFYCPLVLDSLMRQESDINKDQTRKWFTELYDSIVNNPNYGGMLHPDKVDDEMRKTKYSLITRCVSVHDSLNFRPVLYSKHNVLPLLDPEFDPSYLIYPKEMQQKLLVNSADDILEKIKYFNEHDDERIAILKEIRHILKVDEYAKNSDAAARAAIHSIIPEFNP